MGGELGEGTKRESALVGPQQTCSAMTMQDSTLSMNYIEFICIWQATSNFDLGATGALPIFAQLVMHLLLWQWPEMFS